MPTAFPQQIDSTQTITQSTAAAPQFPTATSTHQYPDQSVNQSAATAPQASTSATYPCRFDAREMSTMADNTARLQREEAATVRAEKATKKPKRNKTDEAIRTSTRERKKPDFLQVSSTDEEELPILKHKKPKKDRSYKRDKY